MKTKEKKKKKLKHHHDDDNHRRDKDHHKHDPPANHPVTASMHVEDLDMGSTPSPSTINKAQEDTEKEEVDEEEEEEEEEELTHRAEDVESNSKCDTPTTGLTSDEDGSDNKSTRNNGDGAPSTPTKLASIREVFSYGTTRMKVICLTFGFVFSALSGAVPIGVIIYFSQSFTNLVADPTSGNFMDQIRELAYAFLVLGVIALVSTTGYATFLETSAGHMTQDFKRKWFQALLRQDMTYFDIQDVSGVATLISSNGTKYKRYVRMNNQLLHVWDGRL